MVKISQKNFNLDMDTYLSKRTKPSQKAKTKKTKEIVDESEFKKEVHDYYTEKKSFFDKIINFIAGAPENEPAEKQAVEVAEVEEDIIEEDQEKVVTRKGLLNSVREWLLGNEPDELDEEEAVEEQLIAEDLKEVLKIQNRWLLKLPKKTIKEFKESKDYAQYKETLARYNLIKPKE